MDKVRFGPSGNEQIFYDEGHKSSLEAPAWLKGLGLSAYEYSFGRGYRMTSEMAKKIGDEAKENDILVSIHAPFYINFANPSDEMAEKSYAYVLTGLKLLKEMNGRDLVVHIGSESKQKREDALKIILSRLPELERRVKENGYTNFKICFETMGKQAQIGSWKEIIDICAQSDLFVPTFDFGHIYALNQGNFGLLEDYLEVFNYSISKLGFEKTKNCHIHFSKIEYSQKGEVKHLNYSNTEFGPIFEPCAMAIKMLKLTPTIICESADNMATDAITYKNIFESVEI